MKISNNALSFLLAQYRAIFKRAYVKGLASAVILTAGLAAGQAQATITVDNVDQTGDSFVLPSGDASTSINITAGSNNTIHFGSSSSNNSEFYDFALSGGTLTGNHTSGKDTLFTSNTATLSGVKVTLSGGDSLIGATSANSNSIVGTLNLVDSSSLDISGGSVTYKDINLGEGVEVVIGGTLNQTSPNYYGKTSSLNINNTASSSGGKLNIESGATVTLAEASSISIFDGGDETSELNLNGGTIVFEGSEFVNDFSGTAATAPVKAAVIGGTDNTEINLNDGEVRVSAEKFGELRGETLNLDGAAINIETDGNLVLSARTTISAKTGTSTINVDGSTITNNGRLYLGEALPANMTSTVTVNAKSGTIENAAGKVTTVASGTTVNLDGLAFNNAGIIDIKAGGVVNAKEQVNEDLKTDGIVTLGGTINVGGTLSVGGNKSPALTSGTTLAIADGAVLTTNTDGGGGRHSGLIVVQSNNTLQVSAAQLQAFLGSGDKIDLDGDGTEETNDTQGALALSGIVDFGDAVTLSSFTFSDTNIEAGKIRAGGNAIATANTVTLNKALTAGSSASNLAVEADNLVVSLTSKSDTTANNSASSDSGLEGDLNFKNATVHSNLSFAGNGADEIWVGNTYNLDAYTEKTEANGSVTYEAASGSITGSDIKVVSGGVLDVNAGHWTAAPTITLTDSGSLTVSVEAPAKADEHKYNTDASLSLNGGLVFDLSGDENVTASVTNTSTTASAALDLTTGISVVSGTASGTISASGTNAVVYMNQSDVNAILSADTKTNRNLNKIAILLEGAGGTLDVAGSVDANFTDLKSGTGTAGAISFNQGGEFVVDSLTLRGDSSTGDGATAINIGTGTITADSVNLVDDVTPVTDDKGNDRTSVTIASGTLNVGSSLTSNAGTLTVSGAGSTLNLETATDTEQGLITSLDQITLAGGKATVTAGNWLAQVTDFEVQDGSSLTIGGVDNADGTFKNASLSANALTVASNGTNAALVVDDNGAATFNTLDLSAAGSGAIKVNNGTLTINGQIGDMNPSNDKAEGGANENHHGVYFGDRNSTRQVFQVTGSAGNLVFGEEASLAFFDQSQQSGAATNANGAVIEALVDESAQYKLNVTEGGRVSMDFNQYAFTKEQLISLKKQLFTGNYDRNELLDGFFDIGDSTISGITVKNGLISWDNLADITDIVWDTTNTELGTAVVTDVTESSQIGGSYGALRPDAGTTLVHLVSNAELGNAAANGGNFIGTAPTYDESGNLVTPGTAVDAIVHEGTVFSVKGTGNLADVSLIGSTSADDLTTLAANTASGDTITIGAVTGGSNGNTLFSTAGEGTVNIGSITNVGEVLFTGTTNNVSGAFTAHNATFLGATVNSKDVTLNGDLNVNASNVVIDGALKFTSSHLVAAVQQGANVKVGSLTAANGGFIRVGSAEFTAAEYEEIAAEHGSLIADRYINTVNETDTNTASSGVLEVSGETRLNGATLFVDPEYNMSSSIVSLNTFGGADTTAGQLGTLDGSLVVGKNGIVGVGFESAAELEAAIAQYRDANGSLSAGDVGSIFYVNGQLNVAAGEQIILNGNASHDTVEEIEAEFAAETNAVANADMYLGTHTALIVSDGALDAASRANANHDAAIEFESAEAKIYAQTGAKVLIDGTSFSLRSMNLFDDAGSDGVALTTEDGKGITLESVNGLFSTELKDGVVGKKIQMELQQGQLDRLSELSDPVRAAVVELATATVEVVPPAEGGEGDAGAEGGAQGGENTRATTGTTNRYNVASGTFLGTALTESLTGSELEQASRLAVYAGTAQAVLSASNTTIDAVAGRMGMGAQQGNITFADNSQGAGLWLAPVYKNHDSDSFDAQGVDYGVDMDLYGVALGADYTLQNGVRVGAMFNVGSGDADGQGVGEGVANDFDYYGFAVYGGYSFGQLSLLADVSYTVADNEFDANTNFVSGNYGKISGTADSTLWSVGVSAQYALDFNGVEIAPHAGLRYSNLEVDSYQVQSSGQNVANFDTDSMSIFSIPVGVSISSYIAAGSWTIKPAVDLTLTANVGDDELDGTTTWYDTDNGYGDLSFASSAEVLDTFTYGATVGISAQTGGFSLGLGLNYTGASNANEYGVQANARFVF